jgi:hypothetical protein
MTRGAVQTLLVKDNQQDVAIIRRMLHKYERAELKLAWTALTREG